MSYDNGEIFKSMEWTMVDAECEASNFQTWSGDPRSVQRLFFDDFGCDEQVLLKSLKCEALTPEARVRAVPP